MRAVLFKTNLKGNMIFEKFRLSNRRVNFMKPPHALKVVVQTLLAPPSSYRRLSGSGMIYPAKW